MRGPRLAFRARPPPAPSGVLQTEVDQTREVNRRDPVRQPHLIADDAAVADPAVAAGDEPGDRSLDHGAMSAVSILELPVACSASGCHEEVVVLVESDRAAVLRAGAAISQRAPSAPRTEHGVAALGGGGG